MSRIIITCRRPGFRRAGIAHPARAEYPAERFDAAALEMLRAEPMLQVTELPDDAAGDTTKSKGEAAGEAAGGEVLATSGPEGPAAPGDGGAALARAGRSAPERAVEVAAGAASASSRAKKARG